MKFALFLLCALASVHLVQPRAIDTNSALTFTNELFSLNAPQAAAGVRRQKKDVSESTEEIEIWWTEEVAGPVRRLFSGA